MEGYKVHIDYILAGNVSESAYILTRQGAVCGSSLNIDKLPAYQFDFVDQNDPDVTHKGVMDQAANLLDALQHGGVTQRPGGVRLYNQKYYIVLARNDIDSFYFKKQGGGACVALTKNFIAIGTWNSELKMQNGVEQNKGQCNKRVQDWAESMKKQGS